MQATLDNSPRFRAAIMNEIWESSKIFLFNACLAGALVPTIVFFSREEHSLDEITTTVMVPLVVAYVSSRLFGVLLCWITERRKTQAQDTSKEEVKKDFKFFIIVAILLMCILGILGTITTLLSIPIYWWLGIGWAVHSGIKVLLAFVGMWFIPIVILLIIKALLDMYYKREVWIERAMRFGSSLTTSHDHTFKGIRRSRVH